MDDSEVIFNSHHNDSMAGPSQAPDNLMDFDVLDETNCSNVSTPHPVNRGDVEVMINKNFDKIYERMQFMIKSNMDQMIACTQKYIDKCDLEINVLRNQLQNKSSQNVGNQISHSVPNCNQNQASSSFDTNTDAGTYPPPMQTQNGTTSNHDFIQNNTNFCDDRQQPYSRENVNPQSVGQQPTHYDHHPENNMLFPPHMTVNRSVIHDGSLKMKPHSYDGSEDLDEYLSQFEILADLNRWSYETKSLYLASSLKGDARSMLVELSPPDRRDYHCLVRMLNLRFGSLNRSEIFKANLQSRVRRRDESISELAQSIKKLTRQAYPEAPYSVISTLARDHFIDALQDADIRLRIREAQVRDIAEAEILALRLEAYRVADRQKTNRYRGHHVNKVGSPYTDGNDCNASDQQNLMKSVMDGFRQEFKSLSNDLKQVVKSAQDKQSEKQNQKFRQTNFNPSNGSSNFGQHNRPPQSNRPNGPPRFSAGQNNNFGQGRPNFGNQNNFYNSRNRSDVKNSQGNQYQSNTGASVRQTGPGPQRLQ